MPVITTQNAAELARRSHAPLRRVSKPNTLAQLLELQQRLHTLTLKEETTAVAAAQLTRAYCEAEKLKRIIKGQPANTSQSIREPATKKQPKASVTPLESLPETKPKE